MFLIEGLIHFWHTARSFFVAGTARFHQSSSRSQPQSRYAQREHEESIISTDKPVPQRIDTAGAVDSTPQKKRGRPTEIPDELKRRALNVKGGKARAQILYGTQYPTPQQVKNVYSILKHYRQQTPKAPN